MLRASLRKAVFRCCARARRSAPISFFLIEHIVFPSEALCKKRGFFQNPCCVATGPGSPGPLQPLTRRMRIADEKNSAVPEASETSLTAAPAAA